MPGFLMEKLLQYSRDYRKKLMATDHSTVLAMTRTMTMTQTVLRTF
jgi:hypothetical protein